MQGPGFRTSQDAETLTDSGERGPGAATTPGDSIRDSLLPDFPEAAVDGVLPTPPPPDRVVIPELPPGAVLGARLGLRIISGGPGPMLLAISGPVITLGRELDNTLPLPDAKVSRHHARLELIEDAWVVTDLRSTNGVRLNGLPVTRAGLSPGDFIYIGDAIIRVEPAF